MWEICAWRAALLSTVVARGRVRVANKLEPNFLRRFVNTSADVARALLI
jgi:hypothetical protein